MQCIVDCLTTTITSVYTHSTHMLTPCL